MPSRRGSPIHGEILTRAEVEAYLRRHIPLSAALGLRAVDVGGDRIVLEAPLGPNLNHQATAFGGSVSAVAILAGWATVHFRLRAAGYAALTVIQDSSIRYDAPIHSAFRAASTPVDDVTWSRFTRALARRGKGRVPVDVAVEADGRVAATFHGRYVALAES
jgi:thioesterase domain-containing protein